MISWITIFDEPTFLLVSNPELISPIYRVQSSDDGLFLIDRKKEKVYKIDSYGNTSVLIARKGEGPEEYTLIDDFKLGEDEIWILDGAKIRLMVFTFDGKLKEIVDLKSNQRDGYGAFQVLDDRVVLNTITGSNYKFRVLDKNSRLLEWVSPLDSIVVGFDFGGDKGLSKNENSLSYIHPFQAVIHNFDEELNLVKMVRLDFGQYGISDEELNELNNDFNRAFDLILDPERPKAHSFSIEETKNHYLLTNFIGPFGTGKFIHTAIDKVSGEAISFEKLSISGNTLPIILVGVHSSNQLIWALDMEQFEQLNPSQQQAILPQEVLDQWNGNGHVLVMGAVRSK
ncbi:MAG: 6-bladed beta-propeller [Mongoliitalea sp.]